MLKCGIFPFSPIFKTVTATLIQMHVRKEKTHGFLAFLIKFRHHSFGFNASFA